MNSPPVYAWISWVPPQKGGRKSAPQTEHFCGDVHFDNDHSWPRSGWTLMGWPVQVFGDGRLQVAKIAFLVDDAPQELLRPGERFTLLDGTRVVAHGIVRSRRRSLRWSKQSLRDALLV